MPASGTESYLQDEGAQSYLDFIASEDGAIFQEFLGDAITARIPAGQPLRILDAGCGPGWLTARLAATGHETLGCDAAPLLIRHAQSHYPGLRFTLADLTKQLPYGDAEFDAIVFSMAALDLSNQQAAFSNLHRVLKPGGKIVATIVNPYYGYPVGVWKRGFRRFLLRQPPVLQLRPYQPLAAKQDRGFAWAEGKLTSYFYTLPEQVNAFLAAGFRLTHLQDIMSAQDAKRYNLLHRLFRFPIYHLLEFQKDR